MLGAHTAGQILRASALCCHGCRPASGSLLGPEHPLIAAVGPRWRMARLPVQLMAAIAAPALLTSRARPDDPAWHGIAQDSLKGPTAPRLCHPFGYRAGKRGFSAQADSS